MSSETALTNKDYYDIKESISEKEKDIWYLNYNTKKGIRIFRERDYIGIEEDS